MSDRLPAGSHGKCVDYCSKNREVDHNQGDDQIHAQLSPTKTSHRSSPGVRPGVGHLGRCRLFREVVARPTDGRRLRSRTFELTDGLARLAGDLRQLFATKQGQHDGKNN